MANIKDVARQAGVSISTVSAVINGTARVSPKRTKLVWDAIRQLGYSPDGVARSLRLGRTKSIGLVVGDIANPFFTSLIKVVEKQASEAGYFVLIANSDDEVDKELHLLKLFKEQRVAGIILAPVGDDRSYTEELARLVDVPLVLVDRQLPDAPFDTIVVDNNLAAQMVTNYLIKLNHRRIAIIIGKHHLWTTNERLEGYRTALTRAGIAYDDNLVCFAESQTDAAYHEVQRLLSMPEPSTAIFAANNLMLLGAVQAVTEMGFKCPEEISIAGIDDLPWSSSIRPKLTTVAQPIETMGTRSVELLIGRMEDAKNGEAPRPQASVILTPKFLIRDSCTALEKPASS